MKLTYEDFDQISVIGIKGEFTTDQVEAFRTLANSRLETKIRDIVLNLAEMDFVDSKGLETILWLQEQCNERLGQIRLAAPTDNVRKILDLTRLSGRLESTGEVETAMKSLR